MFTCDAKFAEASVSSWELWKNVISVMSMCESAWKLCVLEDEFNIQISKSSYLYPCPSSVSTSPASSLRQNWVWRVHCHKAAKGSSLKGSGLCGLIPQILLCSDTGESSEPPWEAAEQEGLRFMDGWVPVQDGIMQMCRLLVLSCQCLSYPVRIFKGVLAIINCPFGNMNISYLPVDLLISSPIGAFWKLPQPHLLRVKRDLSLLSTQLLKNSHEWQLRGQQQ